MAKLRMCQGDLPPAGDIVECVYIPKLHVVVVSVQGGEDGSAVGIYDAASGTRFALHRPSAPHQKLLVCYHSFADRLLVSDTKRLGARTDDEGVYLLESALYQLHDKETLNLELTRCDAAVFAKGLGRLNGAAAHTEAASLASRIDRVAARADPRESVSVPCAADQISGLLRSLKTAAKAAGSQEELAVAYVLESRVDMAYKHRMNSELRRLMTFRERGWKYKYQHATPKALARAGFFYDPSTYEDDDRTVCFSCSTALVSWEPTDQPWEEHNRHCPTCPVLTGTCTSNIPLAKYLATTRATTEEHSKIGGLQVSLQSALCVSVGLKKGTSPSVHTLTLWDTEHKPRVLSTVPFDVDALAAAGLSPEQHHCSQVDARFIGMADGGEVLVVLAKIMQVASQTDSSVVVDAVVDRLQTAPPDDAQCTTVSTDADNPAGSQVETRTVGVILVYEVAGVRTRPTLRTSKVVNDPLCMCTVPSGNALILATGGSFTEHVNDATKCAGSCLTNLAVEGASSKPILRDAGQRRLDSRVSTLSSAFDCVSDRHIVVGVLDTGGIAAFDHALQLLTTVDPDEFHATRVLCARHSGILFAGDSATIVELAFIDVPLSGGCVGEEETADIDLDTADVSNAVFARYMTLSQYEESPTVQVQPRDGGWAEALLSFATGHRTAWVNMLQHEDGRHIASNFDLTLPRLFFVKDVRIIVTLDKPYTARQAVGNTTLILNVINSFTGASTTVGSVRLCDAFTVGACTAEVVLGNSVRESMTPCQQLRVRLESGDDGAGPAGNDGNSVHQVCFSASCRAYDAKTGRKTVYAAGHTAFAARVASKLCVTKTPPLEYRQCLEWLSWIQHTCPQSSPADLPLNEAAMMGSLEQALASRDADAFEQLAALLLLYRATSSASAETVQRALVSILPNVRFNTSAVVLAYFSLLRQVCFVDPAAVTLATTTPTARSVLKDRATVEYFLGALRSAASTLSSCVTLPLRVRLDLNDTLLDPNLSEYPRLGWSNVPELTTRQTLGLFECHRLPLSCGASSPSCKFDPTNGVLSVSSITSSLNTTVFDCRADVLLTNVLIPQSESFRQLTIDVWCKSEAVDAKRVVLAHPIHKKPLVLTGIRFRARFIKIALISYSTTGGSLDCSNIRGTFLNPQAVSTPAVRQRWRQLCEEARHARAADFRRLHEVLASSDHSIDQRGLVQTISIFESAVQQNITENEYRRVLLSCAPNCGASAIAWSPSLAYRFLATCVEFLHSAWLENATDIAQFVSVANCSEIFKIACLYGFQDTRENGARLVFGMAAARGSVGALLESLWQLVSVESKRSGVQFAFFPILVKTGLLSIKDEPSMIELVGADLVQRVSESIGLGASADGALESVVLWQLDLLAWLLSDSAAARHDTTPPWALALRNLCASLFDAVLDESCSRSAQFVEAVSVLLRALVHLEIPDIGQIAIVAYRQFLRQSWRFAFEPGIADLCPVFLAMCDRDDQLDAMSDCLDRVTLHDQADRNQCISLFHLVSQDFKVARLSSTTVTVPGVSQRGPPTACSLEDLPTFDSDLSSDDAVLSDNGRRAKRNSSAGCYPAALLSVPESGTLNFSVRIESSTHQGNLFSVGVGTSMRKDYSDGFGIESGSMGIVQKCARKTSTSKINKSGAASASASTHGYFVSTHGEGQEPHEVSLGRRLEAGDIVSVSIDGRSVCFTVNGVTIVNAHANAPLCRAGCTLHTQGVVSIVSPPPPPKHFEPITVEVTSASAAPDVSRTSERTLPARAALTIVTALIAADAKKMASGQFSPSQMPSMWESALLTLTECCEMGALVDMPDTLGQLLAKYFLAVDVNPACQSNMQCLLNAAALANPAVATSAILSAITTMRHVASSGWQPHIVNSIVGHVSTAVDANDIIPCILAVAASAGALAAQSTANQQVLEQIELHMAFISQLLSCAAGEVTEEMLGDHAPLDHLLGILCNGEVDGTTASAIEQTLETLIAAWPLSSMWASSLIAALAQESAGVDSHVALLLTHFAHQLEASQTTTLCDVTLHPLIFTLAERSAEQFVQSARRHDVSSRSIAVGEARYRFTSPTAISGEASMTMSVRTHHHRIANATKRTAFPKMKGPFRRWACDLCDDRQDSMEERFRCIAGCDFDLCQQCSERDGWKDTTCAKFTAVPLRSARLMSNPDKLFHPPVWYDDEASLRVALAEKRVMGRLSLTLLLKDCPTLSFRITGGADETSLVPLDPYYTINSCRSVTRHGLSTLEIVLCATAHFDCQFIDVCFGRTSSGQSFAVHNLVVYTCAATPPPTLEQSRAWLLALRENLRLLNLQEQRALLLSIGTPVTQSCMEMLARGEGAALVFDVLRQVPQLCEEAILHVPKFSQHTRYDHLTDLIVAILTDGTTAEAGCAPVLRTLLHDTRSGQHQTILVSAVTTALLQESEPLRSLCIRDLQRLRTRLGADSLSIASALLATAGSAETFWSTFAGVVPATECAANHFSSAAFEVLEGMVLARPSAVQFLFSKPDASRSTLLDASFQHLQRIHDVGGMQESTVATSAQLVPFLRFLGAACVSPAGQDWFVQSFSTTGIPLLVAACDHEESTALSCGSERSVTYVASLLEMACAGNRQAIEQTVGILEGCAHPPTASVTARKVLASLMFAQPRVPTIVSTLDCTHFQIAADGIPPVDIQYLCTVMARQYRNATDAGLIGAISSSGQLTGSMDPLLARGASFMFLVETDSDVRFAIVGLNPQRFVTAAEGLCDAAIINLTHHEFNRFPESVSVRIEHFSDGSGGVTIRLETPGRRSMCMLSTSTMCTVADEVLQYQCPAKSTGALGRFRIVSCGLYTLHVTQPVFPPEPLSLFDQQQTSAHELMWVPAKVNSAILQRYCGKLNVDEGSSAVVDVLPTKQSNATVCGTLNQSVASRELSQGYVKVTPLIAGVLQSSGHLETALRSAINHGTLSSGVEQLVRQWLSFSTLPSFRGRSLHSALQSRGSAPQTPHDRVPFVAILAEWVVGEASTSRNTEEVMQHMSLLLLQTLQQEHLRIDVSDVLENNLFGTILAQTSVAAPTDVRLHDASQSEKNSDLESSGMLGASPEAVLLKKQGSSYWAEGTGFGTGSTASTWDREKWLLQKQAEDALATTSLLCTATLLDRMCAHPILPGAATTIAAILSSTLLPARLFELVANDSMIDISRTPLLHDAALLVVSALVKDPTLFAEVDHHPEFASVVDTLFRTVGLLERALMQDSDKSVVERYRTTANQVRARRPHVDRGDVELDAAQGYCTVLNRLQFGEAEIAPLHHFGGEAETPSSRCLERLMQELGSLATSLPVNEGSSIFVRYDPDRLNLMKALITGPEGTPYSGGCFEFDLYFPRNYPDEPPKVHLVTTGNGSVRFNPNLYKSGKVCLSILNTWPGRPEEQWSPHCTILQVLMSIQSLILVAEPWFNEPGYERTRGTDEGDYNSTQYNRSIARSTIRWSMVEVLRSPSPPFKRVISAHFVLRKGILDECSTWESDAANAAAALESSDTASASATKCITMATEVMQLKEALAQLEAEGGLLLETDTDDDDGDDDDDVDGSIETGDSDGCSSTASFDNGEDDNSM